jgi:hypothetical protein
MEAGRASGAARMFGGGALLEEVKALKLENRAMREELTYIRKEVRDWPKSYREGSAEVVKVGNKTIVNRKES